MKILVCISKTPDTTSKIAFKDGNAKFEDSGVQWIINPYDEWYALVRAIELKEKGASVTLHLIFQAEVHSLQCLLIHQQLKVPLPLKVLCVRP